MCDWSKIRPRWRGPGGGRHFLHTVRFPPGRRLFNTAGCLARAYGDGILHRCGLAGSGTKITAFCHPRSDTESQRNCAPSYYILWLA